MARQWALTCRVARTTCAAGRWGASTESPTMKTLPKTAALLALLCATWVAHAATLVLDTFDAPAPARSGVAYGAPGSASALVDLVDFTATVPGGVRESVLNVYGNPLDSISALSVGDGRLSVAQGTGAIAETIVSYGAFTRPTGDPMVGGPLLGLDLSVYGGLQFDFSGAEDVLNVNVTYYTSAPLDPLHPLYYSGAGVNVAPASSGAPLSFTLAFANDPTFNWTQVDGVVVLINRAGPTPSTSYTLGTLTFVTAVPEPDAWALMAAGMAVLGLLARRRRVA